MVRSWQYGERAGPPFCPHQGSLLSEPAGLARRHHGNPAAALTVEQLVGLPVLLSGLAALVLDNTEQEALDHHHKVTLEQLQRLDPRTPAPVVYFLAGSLPARANYHLRQLCLLGMVARLGPDSILHRYGRHVLTSPPHTCFDWILLTPHHQQYFSSCSYPLEQVLGRNW